jgi:predicted ATPase
MRRPRKRSTRPEGFTNQFLLEIELEREKIRSFDEYPFCLPAVRALTTLRFDPRVTFLVGENGSGKSTLLEGIAVACGFNAEGGSKNFRFDTRASHSTLPRYLKLVRGSVRPSDGFFLRAESYFNVATEIERLDELEGAGPPIIDSYGGRSLHEQSHGESFLSLLTHRLHGDGLYLFDEPEAALSPQRQLTALALIDDLVRDGSQFIIATHSPILMAYPNATIFHLSNDGVVPTTYFETEHYRVTADFLANPKRMLDILLDPRPGDA